MMWDLAIQLVWSIMAENLSRGRVAKAKPAIVLKATPNDAAMTPNLFKHGSAVQ
jgi:hypothetical protein